MMSCKTYIFKLTSGQLEEAGTVERMWATQHRLMCRRCRAFTRNNARLDEIMAAHKDHLLVPDGSPQSPTDDAPPPPADTPR